MKSFVYTNIGFEPTQYKLLKHLAIEQHRPLSKLIREMVVRHLQRQTYDPRRWKEDYFFRFGPSSHRKRSQTKKINPHDRVVYGL